MVIQISQCIKNKNNKKRTSQNTGRVGLMHKRFELTKVQASIIAIDFLKICGQYVSNIKDETTNEIRTSEWLCWVNNDA